MAWAVILPVSASHYHQPVALLAITTSGPRGQVALGVVDQAPRLHALASGATRGRDLLPAIVGLLSQAGLTRGDLQGIAVDQGPGSFTGVRIGVTTATTMAYALGLPISGLSSLALLAQTADHEGPVAALRDAGRGRVYLQTFSTRGDDGWRTASSAAARLDPALALPLLPGHTLVGEDASSLARALGSGAPCVDMDPSATVLLAHARPALQTGAPAGPASLAPLYLQASTPELRLAGEPDRPEA